MATDQVLFGVSLTVDAGQVVTLLGRNGMGKTTTIRSIMGIVPPKAGTIVFDGRAIHRLPPCSRIVVILPVDLPLSYCGMVP